MKLTLQLQLLPTVDQKADLLATMGRFNEAATFAAKVGFDAGIYGQVDAAPARLSGDSGSGLACPRKWRFGLSPRPSSVSSGTSRGCPVFKPRSAICYDQRVLSFKGPTEVSLWTLSGRLRMPFVCGGLPTRATRPDQGPVRPRPPRRQVLFALHDRPARIGPPSRPSTSSVWIWASSISRTDSDGNTYSGDAVDAVRRRHQRNRERLQRRGTKGAKKALKRQSRRESNFRAAREPLHREGHRRACQGHRSRGSPSRNSAGFAAGLRFASGNEPATRGWAFHQLRSFVEYKARLAGVFVVAVDPRNTSRTCSACGHCEKANRKSQAEFVCRHCGYSTNADRNARPQSPDEGLGCL